MRSSEQDRREELEQRALAVGLRVLRDEERRSLRRARIAIATTLVLSLILAGLVLYDATRPGIVPEAAEVRR